MKRARVVVTGLGTVNPIGRSVPEFWSRCVAGTSGVRRITTFSVPEGKSAIAGIVQGAEGEQGRGEDRCLSFAREAAAEAIRSAGLSPSPGDDGGRSAVILSTAISQLASMEAEFSRRSAAGRRRIEPPEGQGGGGNALYVFNFNAVASALARQLGFRGPCLTVPTGCTGGLDAIGVAMDAIRSGDVDLVLTGATEAPITPLVVAAFGMIGATSLRNDDPEGASRPFDRARDGFVLAEGAGLLVVESYEHAAARGAPILAELTGHGSVNNCRHMTDIEEDGERIARSAEIALRDAGARPDDIDMINAHGSSTPQNDVAEANAFRRLFGERAGKIPVTSVKSQIGHPLSASNSIEAISAVLSIRDGVVPPTLNLRDKDPRCPLDVVAGAARSRPVRRVLKTSSGFSGIHSSLVVEALREA